MTTILTDADHLTGSPAASTPNLTSDPNAAANQSSIPVPDPLNLYTQQDADSIDRDLAAFFSPPTAPGGGDPDPPLAGPRNIPFEEKWAHLSWHGTDHRHILADLIDKLDAAQDFVWVPAAQCLFYVSHGAYPRQPDHERWIMALKKTHEALAKIGFVLAVWPRLVGMVGKWEKSVRKIATDQQTASQHTYRQHHHHHHHRHLDGDHDDADPRASAIEMDPETAAAEAAAAKLFTSHLVLLLSVFYSHLVVCHHFDIHLPLSLAEPNCLIYFIKVLTRIDARRVPPTMMKKLVLIINKLVLCQFGGRERLRELKASLHRFYNLPPISSTHSSPQSPLPGLVKTKATDHDLHTAYAELATRYPTAAAIGQLITATTTPPLAAASASSVPAAAQTSAVPSLPVARRGFAARKKVASHDHLLLPGHDADEDPPLPIREVVDTYLVHHTPTLESVLVHQRPRGVTPEVEWDWEYPDEAREHFLELEEVFYPQLLPYLTRFASQLTKLIEDNMPTPAYYPSSPARGSHTPLSAPSSTPASHIHRPHVLPTMLTARRDREILVHLSLHTLLLLYRHLRLAHPLLGEHMGHTLVDDTNLLGTLIRLLNSLDDFDPYLRSPAAAPDAGEPGFLVDLLRANPGYIYRNVASITDALQLMTLLVRRRPHRVLFMYHNKAFNPLRKCVVVMNYAVMRRALKVVKLMMPFMSRKWRQTNIQIISLIYHHLTPKLVDDYLMTSDADTEATEGLQQEEHTKHLIRSLHSTRYPDAFAHWLSASHAYAAGSHHSTHSTPGSPDSLAAMSPSFDGHHRRYSSTQSLGSSSSSSSSSSDGGMDVGWMYFRDPEDVDGDAEGESAGGREDWLVDEWRDEYEESILRAGGKEMDEWWKKTPAEVFGGGSGGGATPKRGVVEAHGDEKRRGRAGSG